MRRREADAATFAARAMLPGGLDGLLGRDGLVDSSRSTASLISGWPGMSPSETPTRAALSAAAAAAGLPDVLIFGPLGSTTTTDATPYSDETTPYTAPQRAAARGREGTGRSYRGGSRDYRGRDTSSRGRRVYTPSRSSSGTRSFSDTSYTPTPPSQQRPRVTPQSQRRARGRDYATPISSYVSPATVSSLESYD